MDDMHISLFGKLKIQLADQQLIEIEARRAQELLCYLLLHPGHLHEREKLATLMWGDKSALRSKQYLRQTLWQVQSALHCVTSCQQLLLAEHDRIGINPCANFWLDVAIFDHAFASVEKITGNALDPQQVKLLQNSLQLYKSDLLEGWYEDWCIYERERRQAMYVVMLDKLLVYSETHHQYETGLAYGSRILYYDRAHERTHRRLMRLHYLTGNRSAALQQYEACVTALAEELGVGPGKSTVALYEQICADQVNHPIAAAPETHARPGLSFVPPINTQQQLVQIQATLAQLQAQVTHLMKSLEQNAGDNA